MTRLGEAVPTGRLSPSCQCQSVSPSRGACERRPALCRISGMGTEIFNHSAPLLVAEGYFIEVGGAYRVTVGCPLHM